MWMPVARVDDARGDPRVSFPQDSHATRSDPRPRAFLESPTRNARDHTRHHAHPPAPHIPPPEASASSVAAAAGSALATLGKEVLARGRFPGCEVDLVAVRAATSLDFRRCVRARAEHANLVSRAKHTPRAVGADDVLDASDARDDVTHIYVTYDHPDSRHTLGVARVAAPPGKTNNAGREPRQDPPDSIFSAPVCARPGEDFLARILRNDHATAFESAQHPSCTFKVDTLFATGLATALDPSGGPERVKALLIRACEEAAAQTLQTQNAPESLAELAIEAPRGALPREVAGRVLDAVPVDAGVDAGVDGDEARVPLRAASPKLRLRLTRYRLRAPRRRDEETRGAFEPLDHARLNGRPSRVDSSRCRRSSAARRGSFARGKIGAARRELAAAAKKALGADDLDEDTLVAALAAVVVGPFESSPSRGGSDRSCVAFSAASGETVAALETFRRALASRGGAGVPLGAPSAGASTKQNAVVAALVDRFPAPRTTVPPIARGDASRPDDEARHASPVDDRDDGAKDAFATRNAVVSSLKAMREAVARDGALALVMRVTRIATAARENAPGAEAVAVRVEATASNDSPLLPLNEFVLAAAEMGLMLDPVGSGCLVDDSRAFVALRLCRPGYRVRIARPEDVDALVAIEAANWPNEPAMRTRRATVEARVARNPSGNLVLTEDPDAFETAWPDRGDDLCESLAVKGGVYFQRTASLESATAFSWYEKERAGDCRVVEGSTRETSPTPRVRRDVSRPPVASAQPYAQLLDIHVDQTFSRSLGRAVGNELRAFVLNVSMVTPGVAGVCAVTRTRGYREASAKSAGLTYEDYVESAAAARRDRGLFFHVGGGATVVKPVLHWRPADVENDGKGTLIEYPLRSIAAERWLAARRAVGSRDADASRDSRVTMREANRHDAPRATGDAAARKKATGSRASGSVSAGSASAGSGSDADEPAVTVEVSFTTDTMAPLEGKE